MKKINWLLILQGWAMLWVVIGHSPIGEAGEGPYWENTLYHFAYSFHMPLFMLVSGWLFFLTRLKVNETDKGGQTWTYGLIIKDKSLRLLLPGFIFSIIAFASKLLFPGEMSRQVGISLQDIVLQFLYPDNNPLAELWFIVTLFWFFLMTPFWTMVLRNKWIMYSTIFLLIILHYFHPNIDFLCFEHVFDYAIWFYLGVVMSKTNVVDLMLERRPCLSLFVGVAIYALGLLLDSFITTIGGIILSFAIALLADKYYPKIFWSFRNYTYQIFLMGIFAQILIKILYRHINLPYLPTYLMCIAVGIYVPVFVSKMLERINFKPLLYCVGLKPLK